MDTTFHSPSYSSTSTIIAQDGNSLIVFHIFTCIWKGYFNCHHSHDPASQLPWLQGPTVLIQCRVHSLPCYHKKKLEAEMNTYSLFSCCKSAAVHLHQHSTEAAARRAEQGRPGSVPALYSPEPCEGMAFYSITKQDE